MFSFLLKTYKAQQNPNYHNPVFIPQVKSSEIGTLGKYTSMNVDLNTGTPLISIPLYTINYSGLEVPISLSYDASGIKVEDAATPVGLHWMLNYGGTVGRTVKGAPDEGNTKVYNPSVYHPEVNANGYYISNGLSEMQKIATLPKDPIISTVAMTRTAAYMGLVMKAARGIKDLEPDLFYFNALGHSGKFFFDDKKTAQLFTEGDYKIIPSLTNDGFFTHFEWKIYTPSGDQLFFGQNQNYEESKTKVFLYNNVNLDRFTDNAWYITKLKSGSNNQEINFTYTKPTSKSLSLTNSSYHDQLWVMNSYPLSALYGTTNSPPNTNLAYCNVFLDDLRTKSGDVMETEIHQPVIQDITAGDYKVSFSTLPKDDGGVKIDEMVVYYKTNQIKKIKFNYNYFIYSGNYYTAADTSLSSLPIPAGLNTDPEVLGAKKRLKLTSIIETGINDSDPKTYSFQYDETHELPSTLSFAKDVWGYFNGQYGNLSLYPLPYGNTCRYTPGYNGTDGYNGPGVAYAATSRDVNPAYSTTGTLTKIIYPTGGSTEYNYENHTGGNSSIPGQNLQWIGNQDKYSTPTGSLNNLNFTSTSKPARIQLTFYKGGFGSGTEPLSNSCRGSVNTNGYEIYDTNNNLLAKDVYQKLYNSSTNTWISQGNFCYDIKFSSEVNSGVQSATPNGNCTKLNVNTPTVILKLISGMQSDNLYSCFNSTGGSFVQENVLAPVTESSKLVGGLRIKEMKFKDYGGATLLAKTYTYSDPIVMQQPRFIYLQTFSNDNTRGGLIDYSQSLLDDPILSYPINYNRFMSYENGSFCFTTPYYNPATLDFSGPNVSYINVKESDGNGSTLYNYNPPLTYPPYLESTMMASKFPYESRMQTSTAGKINFKETIDKNYNLLRKESTIYKVIKNPASSPARNVSVIKFTPIGGPKYDSYGYPIPDPAVDFSLDYTLQTEKALVDSTKVEDYINGKKLLATTKYYYNSNAHHQLTISETVTPDGTLIKSAFQYPSDLIGTFPLMQNLTNANRIAERVVSTTYKNAIPNSKNVISYEQNTKTSNLLLPISVQSTQINTIGTATEVKATEVTYDQYDAVGNLLQYTTKSGVSTTIIWGYNQTQPIAKIEGAKLSDIPQGLITSIINASDYGNASYSEFNLIAQLNAFKTSLPNYQISTYTYKPLIGVTTITPPSGIREYYFYDTANRLQSVKDSEGKILKEYQYNYKP